MQTDKALEKFTRSNSTEKPVYGANLLGKSPVASETAKEDLGYTLNEEQPIVSNTDCEADSIISGISRTVGYSNIEEKSVPLNESSLPPSTTVEEKINRSENFNVAIKLRPSLIETTPKYHKNYSTKSCTLVFLINVQVRLFVFKKSSSLHVFTF